MPVQTALWRITENGLTEARPSALKREADLHKWLKADPKLLGDLLLIGSEVATDFGGRIDLLAIDPAASFMSSNLSAIRRRARSSRKPWTMPVGWQR